MDKINDINMADKLQLDGNLVNVPASITPCKILEKGFINIYILIIFTIMPEV